MDKVSIVILNWNGLSDTLECLESVSRIDYPNYEVIVVDNGSTDGSPEAINRAFPHVTLIRNERNLGFADGNNVGIMHALKNDSDYVLLLNNDTVVDAGLLDEFMTVARSHPLAGIFGAKIYFFSDPDRIWFAGGRWNMRQGHCLHLGWGEEDDGRKYELVEEVDYVSGCCIFFGAKVARRIGLLDSRFFLTFEDTDWCYRARMAKIKCLFVPRAKVWHKVSTSFGGKSEVYIYYFTRNRLLWAERDLRLFQRVFVYLAIARELYYYSLRMQWPENKAEVRARLVGLRDYLLRRFGAENVPHRITQQEMTHKTIHS